MGDPGGLIPLEELDPVVHQPQRLRILAALHRNRRLAFTSLRDGLELTPGNLASHLARLSEAGYVETRRVLTPSGFEQVAAITPSGSAALAAYARRLREILEAASPPPAPPAEAGRSGQEHHGAPGGRPRHG